VGKTRAMENELGALLLAAQGASGDNPDFPWGVIIIVAIAVLVVAAGVLLAKKVFVRGTMPDKPSEDPGVRSSRRPP
jgi:hypothetical protein